MPEFIDEKERFEQGVLPRDVPATFLCELGALALHPEEPLRD